MTKQHSRLVGQTRDTGFEIGVRRTFLITHNEAWELVTSAQGVSIWLGDVPTLQCTKGASFQLSDGTTGEITVYMPGSHMRLTWHPVNWPRPSIMQLRTIANGDRSVIAFHQEHLPGPAEREERRAFFAATLDALERLL